MDRRILFLFNFVVLIFAKVEWKVEEKISRYGEDLRLLCTTEEYSIDGVEIKRWEGGPKQKMLTLNGAPDQDDVLKYDMSMREEGFDLVIKNVSKNDLDVTYECTYRFKSSGKVMLKTEDAFEERQATKQSEGKNNTIIYVIIPVSLVVLAVVAICISLLLIHRKRKLRIQKNKNNADCNGNSASRERSCLIEMPDQEVRELPASEVPPLETDCFLSESNSSNGGLLIDVTSSNLNDLISHYGLNQMPEGLRPATIPNNSDVIHTASLNLAQPIEIGNLAHTNVNEARKAATVNVVIENRMVRFRYDSELNNRNFGKEVLAKIVVIDYTGRVKVRIHAVDDKKFKAHPFCLIGDKCNDGVYIEDHDITPDKNECICKATPRIPKQKNYDMELNSRKLIMMDASRFPYITSDMEKDDYWNSNKNIKESKEIILMVEVHFVTENPNPPYIAQYSNPINNAKSVEDEMAVSVTVQELVPRTSKEKPYNTQPVGASTNDPCLIDPAPSALKETNELDSKLPDQIGEHEDEMETKVLFASIPPQHSELVTSVTGSEALEPYKTESDGDSVDETSLKDVAKDHASSEPVKIAPQRDFQYSKPDEQETEVHSTVNFKLKREYKTFNLRKKSFNSSSCKWPLPKPSIPEMANAGFFCSGCLTWAQCYSCGLKRLWQEGDDPFDEHLHENCPHLKHIKEKKASGEGS